MSVSPDITTTIAPTSDASGDSNKDVLLIAASCVMAVATALLILLVKLLEKCMPADRTATLQREKREKDVKKILDEQTKLISYADWILHERIKHNGVQVSALNESEPIESPTSPAHLSSVELSSRLESSPKEEEVWATDCAVCLSEFAKDEMVRELPCEHIFHDACIQGWFMKAKETVCPLCRHQLHTGLSSDNLVANPSQPSTDPFTVEDAISNEAVPV